MMQGRVRGGAGACGVHASTSDSLVPSDGTLMGDETIATPRDLQARPSRPLGIRRRGGGTFTHAACGRWRAGTWKAPGSRLDLHGHRADRTVKTLHLLQLRHAWASEADAWQDAVPHVGLELGCKSGRPRPSRRTGRSVGSAKQELSVKQELPK